MDDNNIIIFSSVGFVLCVIGFIVLYHYLKKKQEYKSFHSYTFPSDKIITANETEMLLPECQTMCNNDNTCKGVVFSNDGGTCSLYNDSSVLVLSDTTDTSYSKNITPINVSNTFLNNSSFQLCGNSKKKHFDTIKNEADCLSLCNEISDEPCRAVSYNAHKQTSDIYTSFDLEIVTRFTTVKDTILTIRTKLVHY